MGRYSGPKFTNLLQGGELPSHLTLQNDPRVMNQYRAQATSSTPTPWATMSAQEMTGKIQDQKEQTISNNLRNSKMMQQSAMQGRGMDDLTAQRMQGQTGLASMLGKQRLRGQESGMLQDIGIQDQLTKDKMLSNLPQMEYASGAADRYNIANKMALKDMEDNFNQNKYKSAMGYYGAKKTGKAIGESGSGGDFWGDMLKNTDQNQYMNQWNTLTDGFNK